MANPIRESLRKAVSFLEKRGYRYALIGGIANQVWGQARFTYDIDIKVLVSDTKYDPVSEDINGTSFEITIQPSEQYSDLILRSNSDEFKLYDQDMNPIVPERILSDKNRRIIVYKGLKDIVYLICSEQSDKIHLTLNKIKSYATHRRSKFMNQTYMADIRETLWIDLSEEH